jgi:hypothetical protein
MSFVGRPSAAPNKKRVDRTAQLPVWPVRQDRQADLARNRSIFPSHDDLHLICRFAAAQLISVSKHFRGADNIEHPRRRYGYNRDSSQTSDVRRAPSALLSLSDGHSGRTSGVLRGYQREETARFVAFRSHWRFEAEFCTPAEPQEKGGVEGEVGYFRRNHWVPVPEAADIAERNRQLLNACQQDERRLIAGREQTVGAGVVIEREHLLPLATEGADLAQTSFPTVNGLGCVKVLTNTYSVPLPAGAQVQAKAYASTLRCGMRADAWPDMSAATGGNNRSSIWSITWMCSIGSLAHWLDRSPWSRGARLVCGHRASTGSGKH